MSELFNVSKIDWKWVGISIVIFIVIQIILGIIFPLLGLVTLGLAFLFSFLIKPVVYLVGGFITGFFSPGVTIYEPAIGALISTVLGFIFEAGRRGKVGLFGLIISAAIAFTCAMVGATFGEKKSKKPF